MRRTQNKSQRKTKNAHHKSKRKTSERARFEHEQRRKFAAAMRRFEKEFPTVSACIDKIYKMVIGRKQCPRCEGKKFTHESGSRFAYCARCDTKISFTAGESIFHGMRLARPLLAMVMLALRNVKFNAHQMSKYFNLPYDTAWEMHRKIMGASLAELSNRCKKVSSFIFNEVIQRRSKETAARQHPNTEQLDEFRTQTHSREENWFEKKIAEFYGDNDLSSPERKKDIADFRQVYDTLNEGPLATEQILDKVDLPVPTVFIALGILTICKLVGKTKNDLYEQIAPEPTSLTEFDALLMHKVSDAVKFIDFLYKGVSRRYIQLYAAAYWCFSDHTKEKRARLLNQFCTNKSNVADLKNYVSPLMIDFAKD